MRIANNPLVFLFKRTWKYSKGNRKRLVLTLIMAVLGQIVQFITPLIFALLLNTIQTEGISAGNLPKLLGIASLFLVKTIVFWALHGPSRIMEQKNAFLMRKNYKKYLLNGTLNLPLGWHTDHHSGDTIDKIEKGSKALHDFASSLFMYIGSIVTFITSYLALVFFNLHASYIVLFVVVIAFTTIIKTDNRLAKKYAKYYKIQNSIAAKIFDSISNITTIVILRLQKLVSKDIVKKIMSPFKLFMNIAIIDEIKWAVVSVYSNMMIILVLGSYLLSTLSAGSVVLIGSLYALYEYVSRINNVFFTLAWQYSGLVREKTAVENSEILSGEFIEEDQVSHHELDKWKQLRIEGLSFAYYNKKDGTLDLSNISLTIKKGEKIALVGESGSGKTTFMKLLKGLYKPTQGEVFVDNHELKGKFRAIKNNTTLIPQEPELFATTIRRNMTMGLKYTQNELDRFSKIARFDEVVARLPKKYESSIVEKGVNLSGGEKQRLALVRGLLAAKDSPLILMDEPTSSVDAANEMSIFESIFNRFKRRTMLVSVHRLHLLRTFDKIYLFDKGQIIATGTLNELLKNSKEFQTIWKKYVRKHKKNK